MTKANYFILTGAMGAGKSTVLTRLKAQGILCIDDPARQILREQRLIGGSGVPETDPALFNQLMLSRAIHLYETIAQGDGPVVFDRGIPDLIAYAELFEIDTAVYERAAAEYRYGNVMLFFPGWKEIYAADDERKVDFESARKFGEAVAGIYQRLGHQTVEVPRVPIEERVAFIVDLISR